MVFVEDVARSDDDDDDDRDEEGNGIYIRVGCLAAYEPQAAITDCM
jgi:hypothetical protein